MSGVSVFKSDINNGRGNYESSNFVLVPSAAYSATFATEPVYFSGMFGHFILDVTAVGGTSVTPEIQGFIRATQSWYPILTSAAVTATGTVVYKVGPAFTAVANLTANDILPQIFRMAFTHVGSVTYSVSCNLG